MYAKIVFMEIMKKGNGSKGDLEILIKEVFGISSVKKKRNILDGMLINIVLNR